MPDFKEQHMCYKFCFKMGKTAIEICGMLKLTFREETMSWTQIFEWLSELKSWWNYASEKKTFSQYFYTNVLQYLLAMKYKFLLSLWGVKNIHYVLICAGISGHKLYD